MVPVDCDDVARLGGAHDNPPAYRCHGMPVAIRREWCRHSVDTLEGGADLHRECLPGITIGGGVPILAEKRLFTPFAITDVLTRTRESRRSAHMLIKDTSGRVKRRVSGAVSRRKAFCTA